LLITTEVRRLDPDIATRRQRSWVLRLALCQPRQEFELIDRHTNRTIERDLDQTDPEPLEPLSAALDDR
jgi:hypothetical protein